MLWARKGRHVRVLVTGATGFVGNLIARRLVVAGHEVVGLTSGSWKPRVPPPGVEPAHLHNVLYGGQFDALVHAAGPSNVRTCHEQPAVVGVALQDWSRLLERSWVNRAQVVLLSSHAVYGTQKDQPISEGVALAPRSVYGAMKAAQEHLALAFYHAKGLPVTILRCGTLCGGAERPDALVRRLADAAIAGEIRIEGTGEQTRDICDVFDAVEAIARCFGRDDVAGEVYNIGSGEAPTIGALASLVADEVAERAGKRPNTVLVPQRAHEEGDVALDVAKARKAKVLLCPALPWRDAVKRTVKWCLSSKP